MIGSITSLGLYPKVADGIDWFRCERRDHLNHRELNLPPADKRYCVQIVSSCLCSVCLASSVYYHGCSSSTTALTLSAYLSFCLSFLVWFCPFVCLSLTLSLSLSLTLTLTLTLSLILFFSMRFRFPRRQPDLRLRRCSSSHLSHQFISFQSRMKRLLDSRSGRGSTMIFSTRPLARY